MSKVLEVKGYTAEEIKSLMSAEDKYKIIVVRLKVFRMQKDRLNSTLGIQPFFVSLFLPQNLETWVKVHILSDSWC